jgi:FkbM family methyltransferase
MTYYKNPVRRYLLRRGFLKRVGFRLRHYQRTLTKDLLTDIADLLKGRDVKTILDVGANVGFMTFQFQRRFPGAQIHCFEPNPNVYRILETSYSGDANIHCHPVGIGDVSGELNFNINANSGTSSFLSPTPYHLAHQAHHILASQVIPIITLDNFARDSGIEHIDILKLDIEGYELKALQGAARLLACQSIDLIYTEVNIVRSYEGQVLFHELTTFLEAHEYFLYNLEDFIAQETPIHQAVLGNAVYLSAAFRKYLENRYGAPNCGW